MKSVIILSSILISSLMANASVITQPLHSGWKFRQNNLMQWHPATVPGTVHTDLMASGMIPDPFIAQNERMVQWVDKEDWLYSTTFDLDPAVSAADSVSLVFDGLDTYADVFLNDSLILKADNMFRRWEVPVASLLKPSGNNLRILFNSPLKTDIPKYEALGLKYPYPASNDQSENGGVFNKKVSVFARKAGYHYGWDWGPRLVTSGIWRPVYLKAWSGPVIDDVFIRTLSASGKEAHMTASVEINSPARVKGCTVTVGGEKTYARTKTDLTPGLNRIEIPFTVKNPRLWWCNGLGNPELYRFDVKISAGHNIADTRSVTAGIRTIELVRDEDAQGRTFYFRLNGRPVFAKGANYIPSDNFLPRVTTDKYRRTIADAARANMNMLRVWGGGIYEDDRFYSLCDSMGIMVWQDFMFACSMYPAEGALLDNIRHEAVDNVRRLRNHPSIAVWCGNNECLDAWYGWGWRRRAEAAGEADMMRRQFDDVYFSLLPQTVAEHDPDIAYTPSSPFSRPDGSSQAERGDFHFWSVWGSGAPIELYNKQRSRFFSEYGFQSFPEIETVRKYAPDSASHFIDSDVMLAHQRAGAGANRKLEKYLLEGYPEPKDFESMLYMTQVLQGDAIRTAIEAHRRDRPYCMGSLFWQHNDCWPVASWSSRDYYGRWKAQHYFATKAYRDIMLSLRPDSLGAITLYIASDRKDAVPAHVDIDVLSLDGRILTSLDRQVNVQPDSVTVLTIPASELAEGIDPRDAVVTASLRTPDDSTYETLLLLAPQKEVRFPQAVITCGVSGSDGNYTVTVKSDKFVRAFRMTLGDGDYFFADNYFDLLPGREYRVGLHAPGISAQEVRQRLSHTDLRRASKTSGN